MKPILSIYDLLPALLLIIQAMAFLLITMAALRYMKVLRLPYAGMEHSRTVTAAAFLLSAMIISFADADGIGQAVSTFHNYDTGFYRNLFLKHSQFILIIVLAECLFGFLCFISFRILPGFRQSSATENDVQGAVLQAIVVFVIAGLVYSCAKEIIELITPKYINFT